MRDDAATADIRVQRNGGVLVDVSLLNKLIDRTAPSYCWSLEQLLRYYIRPPCVIERVSVIRFESGRVTCVRYVLP